MRKLKGLLTRQRARASVGDHAIVVKASFWRAYMEVSTQADENHAYSLLKAWRRIEANSFALISFLPSPPFALTGRYSS